MEPSSRFRWLRIQALSTCLVLTAACAGPQAPSATDPGVRTVVLVTVDTWRRDANGFLGGLHPSPTPFLDRLAAEGSVGIDAITPVPLTAPSHWSILSGRWPWRDSVRTNGDPIPEDAGPTLPQILSADGWRTGAFVSAAVLDRRYGFDRGFETYDDTLDFGSGDPTELEAVDRPAEATVTRAVDWLRGLPADDRVLLWVHLFDPHFPYAPPGGPFSGDHAAYLGEVAYADSQIERLARELDSLGRDRTASLWVVLADHGEGFGEHGERTHGMLLHGATHRIPFLLAGADVPRGTIEGQVSTVDALPTVLARLSLPVPEVDGLDVLAPLPEQRAVPLESLEGARTHGLAPVIGLRRGQWLWEASPAEHLWNLADDPYEEHDLAAAEPERSRSLRSVRRSLGIAPFERSAPASAETARALRALGYMGGGASVGDADVREFVRTGLQWFFELVSLEAERAWEPAEELSQRFLTAYPASPHGWIEAGFVAVGRGDLTAAEERFREAARLDPTSTSALVNLGNVLWQTGRPTEAETFYAQTLEIDPRDYFALYNLGTLRANQGDRDGAVQAWRSFLEAYPEDQRAPGLRATLEGWSSAP